MAQTHNYLEKPKLTVVEARKILGRKYSYLEDTQVIDIINILTKIARKNLDI